MKVDYGAVALIPKGEFNATEQYATNDLVSYNGSSFIVKAVPPIGTLPTNTAYFTVNASGTSPATSSTVGTVKPDNSTIEVDNDGVISVKSEVLDRVSSSEQALTVNLLNSKLGNKTVNGITITKNSDITYILNGTATNDSYFNLNSTPFRTAKACKFKASGCPQGGSAQSYFIAVTLASNGTTIERDIGDGAEASLEANTDYTLKIGIKSGTVCDNLVFKPMLTTNLSATYNDYVSYSGSSGKLDTDFKTLSEKIGNVGNTDLQSQLNAATQSIAQNTTDIAANAAGITALNTGLATKISTHTDTGAHGIKEITYNTSAGIVVGQDAVTDEWYSLSDKFTFYDNVITPLVSGFTMTFHGLYLVGRLRILIAHIVLTQNYASETVVAKINTTAPTFLAECTCRDNQGHFATFRLDTDKNIMVWGQAQATNGGVYLCQFTYFA